MSMNDISEFVDNHNYEIDTTMTKKDWLNTYHKALIDQDLNMDSMIQHTRHPEKFKDDLALADSHINLINSKFNLEDTNTTWKDYGEYSGYLNGLLEARNDLIDVKNSQKYYDSVVDFMALHDTQANKTDLTRESLFRQLS